MLSQKMQDALNAQINAEAYSANLYLAMSAHAHSMNLEGFAHWFRKQYEEETAHMLKFVSYLLDRRGTVELKAINAPPAQWESMLAMFEATMKHEEHVTQLIHNLADQAAAERDHATSAFLQWFVSEQVEEEATVDSILQKLRTSKDSIGGLLVLDHHVGKRA
ncbi:MAG: ferritin [Pirellulales bacterium]|nr:ferritin [Pirellulales bacterium]